MKEPLGTSEEPPSSAIELAFREAALKKPNTLVDQTIEQKRQEAEQLRLAQKQLRLSIVAQSQGLVGEVAEERKRLKDEERASAQQRREAAREAQKQERRLAAQQEQEQAATRRAKQKEEREKQRIARQTARAANQEAERQRRTKPRTAGTPAPAAPAPQTTEPARTAPEQQNASEEVKAQYAQIGRDYFTLFFRPADAVSKGLVLKEFIEPWLTLIPQLHRYFPDQQADLIRRIASGLKISEISLSSEYLAAGTMGRNGQIPDKVDYLANTMSDMLGYSGVEKTNFLYAIQRRLDSEGRSLSTVHKAIAAWISARYREPA